MKISQIVIRLLFVTILFAPAMLKSQVQLRDTLVSWQHHWFELNDNYGMGNYSTDDKNIQQVHFNGKVIENDLIRLVVLPEYGARVLSFVYKPTGHEYLYQSACGSPYGIGDGNFYYNWLMVYGGIFPTFPEPEHGKTWFLPWAYEVLKNTSDTVVIAMEYTDDSSFAGRPGGFNNGITKITCRVEVGVYKGTSLWDFKVSLKNNKNEDVRYEYWTCTTLTPGSDGGDTGSPLNSEMLVPIEKYEAAWSPGSWIGNYGSLNDFENINYLSEWDDMGIAYAHNLKDNYWGVINQNNKEGIFRISENVETPGMKFWTWGKNNVDNNLFDFSNGGQDNYIELWAGTSKAFFSDAVLSPMEEKSWREAYAPTVNLSGLCEINDELAANIAWDHETAELSYELLSFHPNSEYRVSLSLNGDNNYTLVDNTITASTLGNSETFLVSDMASGVYTVALDVYDEDSELVLQAEKDISTQRTTIENLAEDENFVSIASLGNKVVNLSFKQLNHYSVQLYSTQGQLVFDRSVRETSLAISVPSKGLYILSVKGDTRSFTKKLLIQ